MPLPVKAVLALYGFHCRAALEANGYAPRKCGFMTAFWAGCVVGRAVFKQDVGATGAREPGTCLRDLSNRAHGACAVFPRNPHWPERSPLVRAVDTYLPTKTKRGPSHKREAPVSLSFPSLRIPQPMSARWSPGLSSVSSAGLYGPRWISCLPRRQTGQPPSARSATVRCCCSVGCHQ